MNQVTQNQAGGRPPPGARFLARGLRGNPFANRGPWEAGPSRRAEALLRRAWAVLELRGEKGAGKTHTLMRVLEGLEVRGAVRYQHLARQGERFRVPRGGVAFGLDEAQRAHWLDLAALARWRRAAPGRRVVLATHVPVARALRPALTLRVPLVGVEREDLDRWVEARLRSARVRDEPAAVTLTEGARAWLCGPLRLGFQQVVDVLYQAFQDLPADGVVGVEQLRRAWGEAVAPSRVEVDGVRPAELVAWARAREG